MTSKPSKNPSKELIMPSATPHIQALLKNALNAALIVLAAIALAAIPTGQAYAWEWSGWGKSVSGTGVIKTESRNLSGITGISLALPAMVASPLLITSSIVR